MVLAPLGFFPLPLVPWQLLLGKEVCRISKTGQMLVVDFDLASGQRQYALQHEIQFLFPRKKKKDLQKLPI